MSSLSSPPTAPTSKKPRLRVKTLILSDIHLGTKDAKAREATRLLKSIEADTIILNGDIIDIWALKRKGVWQKHHTRFIRTLLKKMEKEDTRLFYIRGNHDDALENYLPVTIGRLTLLKEHIHVSAQGKRYLVVHGDGFDSISTNHKWIAVLGAVGYDYLLAFNRLYNAWRRFRGKEYYSISRVLKLKVKSAVSFMGQYEKQLQKLAKHKECDGIICGHIHHPDNKIVGETHYLNSGDWVESLSFIIESLKGDFSVHYYNELENLITIKQ